MTLGTFSVFFFFFSSRRRHTRYIGDWSSDVCSSDLLAASTAGSYVVTYSSTCSACKAVCDYICSSSTCCKIDIAGSGIDHNRSEERRVGKEWRSRWLTEHYKKYEMIDIVKEEISINE